MLATLAELKNALGILDTSQDALLTSCLTQANGLVAGYVGADLSDTSDRSDTQYRPCGASYLHLPVWPVISVSALLCNGVALVEETDYYLDLTAGAIFYSSTPGSASSRGDKFQTTYKAGYTDIPADLNTVCLNIAAAVFNRGGSFSTPGSNELKTLTMFDAMSMSFDTAEQSSDTPEGLIKVWSFMLNKYRINTPVMK